MHKKFVLTFKLSPDNSVQEPQFCAQVHNRAW